MALKKICNTLMIMAALIVLLAGAGYAMPDGRGDLFKGLNLTGEQQKALDANREKHREEIKALSGRMHETMELMRQELEKPELDMADINRLNDEIKKIQSQMTDFRLQRILEVRKVLSPDQFRKFSEKRKEFKKNFGKKCREKNNEI